MERKQFGLIGKTLKHSYSKIIHPKLGRYNYDHFELKEDELEAFTKKEDGVCGFNVTIPYKTKIIEYLDVVDARAKRIGAVNTVVRKNGKLYGYNTDYDGMKYMLLRAEISLKDKVVMILGSGGTSKTANAVATDLCAKKIVVVSRSGEVNYLNYQKQTDVQVIINTTPVGMFPDIYLSPVEIDAFPHLEGVADVIYNPATTLLTFKAMQRGLKYTSGYNMLVEQANVAKQKFVGRKSSTSKVENIVKKLAMENLNVVLIGMPGSGKSSVGKMLAKKLGKEFIDTDKEIEKLANASIPEIFEREGEKTFRDLENQVIKEVGKLTNKVIATGGGVVKNRENLFALKANGTIFLIDRDIDKLATSGRPLSKDMDAVKKLYEQRRENYLYFADHVVKNDGTIGQLANKIMEKL